MIPKFYSWGLNGKVINFKDNGVKGNEFALLGTIITYDKFLDGNTKEKQNLRKWDVES